MPVTPISNEQITIVPHSSSLQNVSISMMGPQGPPGQKGDQGIQGIQGIRGERGPIGTRWRGEWNSLEIYYEYDIARKDDSVYIYINQSPSSGNDINNLEYWDLYSVSDKQFKHTQSISSDNWIINHGMNKCPSVTVIDSGGTIVEGDIIFTDTNVLTIVFSAPFTGIAYLN